MKRAGLRVSADAVDEITFGDWLHVEDMGGGHWFVQVAQLGLSVVVRGNQPATATSEEYCRYLPKPKRRKGGGKP